MTVGLTNCQLQVVNNIRSYEVCWGVRGGGDSIYNENTFITPSTRA